MMAASRDVAGRTIADVVVQLRCQQLRGAPGQPGAAWRRCGGGAGQDGRDGWWVVLIGENRN